MTQNLASILQAGGLTFMYSFVTYLVIVFIVVHLMVGDKREHHSGKMTKPIFVRPQLWEIQFALVIAFGAAVVTAIYIIIYDNPPIQEYLLNLLTRCKHWLLRFVGN
jgi:hypothetical protein